jgi:hypothetical protein
VLEGLMFDHKKLTTPAEKLGFFILLEKIMDRNVGLDTAKRN